MDGVALSDRLEFLYAALEDTQSSIRAFDIKSGFLFLILCAPIPVADKIIEAAPGFACAPLFLRLMIVSTVVVWFMSAAALFMATAAIGNAANHVEGNTSTGAFFGGDLFSFDWTDVLYRRRRRAKFDVVTEMARLPSAEDEIVRELTFEKLKLTYIRQIKAKRFNSASVLAVVWAPLMIASTLIAKLY